MKPTALEPTVEKVCDLVAEYVERDRANLKPDTSLADLAADELDFVGMIVIMEKVYGVEISDEVKLKVLGTTDRKEGLKRLTMAKFVELVQEARK